MGQGMGLDVDSILRLNVRRLTLRTKEVCKLKRIIERQKKEIAFLKFLSTGDYYQYERDAF